MIPTLSEHPLHYPRDFRNKGTNVTSDNFVTFESEDIEGGGDCRCGENSEPITVRQVREQLHSVIELMGPNTPHFTQNSSTDADNEESIMESSVISSVVKVKQISESTLRTSKNATFSTTNSPRENSNISALLTTDTQCDSFCFNECDPMHETCCKCCNQYHGNNVQTQPPFPPCMCGSYGGGGICGSNPVQFELERSKFEKPPTNGFLAMCLGGERKRRNDRFERNTQIQNLLCEDKKPSKSTPKCICLTNEKQPRKCSLKTLRDLSKKSKDFNLNGKESNNRKLSNKTINGNKSKAQCESSIGTTRIDVYYFDHGNAAYYRTTDTRPITVTDVIADATDNYTAKFWAGFFGMVHIGFAFFTSFFLQLLRFLLCSLIRPLTVGILQLFSDYGLKPFLAVVFNAILQPPCIFLYNIAVSLRDLCEPIAEAVIYFLKGIAIIFKSIRLLEVRKERKLCTNESNCQTELGESDKNLQDASNNKKFDEQEENKEKQEK